MSEKLRAAAFFDRDGTINVDFGHVYRCEDLQFIPGIPERIRAYNEKGVLVIVITNQAGIAKGIYREADMHRFHAYMNRRLESDYGAHIDAFYFCPHHPDYTGPCECRKPNAGLILNAARDHRISLPDSVMYGDKESDRLAAEASGVGAFFYVDGQGEIKKA